jgi:hypothetical protein
MRSFVSVYVDMAAGAAEVREAVTRLLMPDDVVRVETSEGPTIARRYADALAALTGAS